MMLIHTIQKTLTYDMEHPAPLDSDQIRKLNSGTIEIMMILTSEADHRNLHMDHTKGLFFSSYYPMLSNTGTLSTYHTP